MFNLLSKFVKLFFEVLQTFVLALAIFLVAYLFLLRPHQVIGQSMTPNFADGEYLLTDKISYRFHQPQRGDVIVFRAPPTHQEEYIKRIIGLPGETISVRNHHLYINDRPVNETYLSQNIPTLAGSFLKESITYTLQSNEYFVVGDNRPNSSDSRTWGPIKSDDIVGKAWFVYWPPTRVGVIPSVTYAFN